MATERDPLPGLNVVVDLSHHNGSVDFKALRDDGILGVIHKATQGTRGRDPDYAAHRDAARAAGLLWGAYHFGTASDGVMQADNFLEAVGSFSDTLLALDFEPNPAGPSMGLEEARAFIVHVRERTGRFPGFYSGHTIKELLGAATDATLQQCWFWLAQYGPTPVVPPNWTRWTFWQYTDGALGPGPHEVAGRRLDRDRFNGSRQELLGLWHG